MRSAVVLVTGCSEGGTGYELCKEFAKHGCRVYAGVRRLASAEGLKPLGAVLLELDVTSSQSRQQAIATILQQEGRLDILVNNAAIVGQASTLVDMPLDNLQTVYDTNVLGPLALAQLVIPHMAKLGHGLIVNITAAVGHTFLPFLSVYGSSKAALTNATNALRLEVEPLGIKVMEAVLGGVNSRMPHKVEASLARDWPNSSMYLKVQNLVLKAVIEAHKGGGSVEAAARTVAAAALRPRPPRRLWTGGPAMMMWFTTFWPWRMVDSLVTMLFKISSWDIKQCN